MKNVLIKTADYFTTGNDYVTEAFDIILIVDAQTGNVTQRFKVPYGFESGGLVDESTYDRSCDVFIQAFERMGYDVGDWPVKRRVKEGWSAFLEDVFPDCLVVNTRYTGGPSPSFCMECQGGRGYTLFKYTGNEAHVQIPETVCHISDNAFSCNEDLLSVSIPEGVMGIGEDAFAGCTKLKHLDLKCKEAYVEFNAFCNCGIEQPLTLPEFLKGREAGTIFIKDDEPGIIAYKPVSRYGFHYEMMTDGCHEVSMNIGDTIKLEDDSDSFSVFINPMDIFSEESGMVGLTIAVLEMELKGKVTLPDLKESTEVDATHAKVLREVSLSEMAEIFNNLHE